MHQRAAPAPCAHRRQQRFQDRPFLIVKVRGIPPAGTAQPRRLAPRGPRGFLDRHTSGSWGPRSASPGTATPQTRHNRADRRIIKHSLTHANSDGLRLTHANTILPLKVPLKMISLRPPSRMINSDRTDIRLLGQEHNRGQAPVNRLLSVIIEQAHRQPADDQIADCAARSLSGARPASVAWDGPIWRGFGLRLSRPACGGGSRAVAQAGTARVLFRSHDAPRHARNPDLAVLLERAHFRDGVCPDPLLRRCADLLRWGGAQTRRYGTGRGWSAWCSIPHRTGSYVPLSGEAEEDITEPAYVATLPTDGCGSCIQGGPESSRQMRPDGECSTRGRHERNRQEQQRSYSADLPAEGARNRDQHSPYNQQNAGNQIVRRGDAQRNLRGDAKPRDQPPG